MIHVLEPLVCRARRDPSRQLKNRTLQTTQESIDIATRNPPRASRLSFGFSFSKHHASMAVQNLAEAQWLPHALTSGALEAKPRIRRFARAELRIEQRLYFCELPDSPRSSSYTQVTDDSNEDDFNYGSLNDQAGQPFLDSYGADQINQVHLTDCTSGSSSTTQALSYRPNHRSLTEFVKSKIPSRFVVATTVNTAAARFQWFAHWFRLLSKWRRGAVIPLTKSRCSKAPHQSQFQKEGELSHLPQCDVRRARL